MPDQPVRPIRDPALLGHESLGKSVMPVDKQELRGGRQKKLQRGIPCAIPTLRS